MTSKDKLAAIINQDLEATIDACEAQADNLLRLMDEHPTHRDWNVWARKEERARQRINRYRTAIEQRKKGKR